MGMTQKVILYIVFEFAVHESIGNVNLGLNPICNVV